MAKRDAETIYAEPTSEEPIPDEPICETVRLEYSETVRLEDRGDSILNDDEYLTTNEECLIH